MKRNEILNAAQVCVTGKREQDYGSPENNFQTIGDLWTAYLKSKLTVSLSGVLSDPNAKANVVLGLLKISAVDVAAMMSLLKISRVASGHAKSDNWIDLAGYAACGGEIQAGTLDDSGERTMRDVASDATHADVATRDKGGESR